MDTTTLNHVQDFNSFDLKINLVDKGQELNLIFWITDSFRHSNLCYFKILGKRKKKARNIAWKEVNLLVAEIHVLGLS
jgi:hypothetical protein